MGCGHRVDVLVEAWARGRAGRGAAGVGGVTLADVEVYGVGRLLDELAADLRAGTYRPAPVRRQGIPEAHGGTRPLGIPTIRDRVAQQAARIVLEPVFEADFVPVSCGYRPRRSATQALERIRIAFPRGCRFVAECDIRDFFGGIDQGRLMGLVERRVSDRRVRKLIRRWLRAGAMVDGGHRQTVAGTPRGGVISPLVANIVLHELDRRRDEHRDGLPIRVADDLVVRCRTRGQAEGALAKVAGILTELGLELHPDKSGVSDLTDGREGFDFLGCHFHARVSGRLLERGVRRYHLQRWPSRRGMGRLRERVRALTGRGRAGVDVRATIARINPMGNYFRTGDAADKFTRIDRYLVGRLRGVLVKRYGRHLRAGQSREWTREWLEGHGLCRLRGAVRYPGTA